MKIVSIAPSINGEICREHQGSLTVFVRLWGCNAKPRCSYCDSQFSYTGTPKEMTVPQIVKEVLKYGIPNVTITGGEPLIQKGTRNLIKYLFIHCDKQVSVETNSTKFIPYLNPRVSWVADYKLPSSGIEHMMKIANYYNLGGRDIVKFVVADKADFDRALDVIPLIIKESTQFKNDFPKFAFSPCWGTIKPETLAKWMIENSYLRAIGAIYSLQVHKLLNVL